MSSNDVKKMGEFMKKLNPTINEDFTDNIISAFLRALNPGVGNVVDNIIKSENKFGLMFQYKIKMSTSQSYLVLEFLLMIIT